MIWVSDLMFPVWGPMWETALKIEREKSLSQRMIVCLLLSDKNLRNSTCFPFSFTFRLLKQSFKHCNSVKPQG